MNGNRQFFTAPGRQLAAARPNDGTRRAVPGRLHAGQRDETRYERIAGIDAASYYADWTERERKLPGFTTAAARQAARDRGAPRGVAVALLERTRRGGVRLSLRGRGRRHVALRHRGCPARHPSRRGAGAPQLPHDLAVAQLRAQGRRGRCRPASRSSCASPCCRRRGASRRAAALRLSIAGGDADHFVQTPHGRPPLLTLLNGGERASVLDLPTSEA